MENRANMCCMYKNNDRKIIQNGVIYFIPDLYGEFALLLRKRRRKIWEGARAPDGEGNKKMKI